MIKLKKIYSESFAKPLEKKIKKWLNELDEGQIVVKDLGRYSQIDEIYQFVKKSIKTDDYSHKSKNLAVTMVKIGIFLYDDSEGLIVNLYGDEAKTKPTIVTLDDAWRNLEAEEITILKNALKDKVPYTVIMSKNTGEMKDETYKQFIEKQSNRKIKFK